MDLYISISGERMRNFLFSTVGDRRRKNLRLLISKRCGRRESIRVLCLPTFGDRKRESFDFQALEIVNLPHKVLTFHRLLAIFGGRIYIFRSCQPNKKDTNFPRNVLAFHSLLFNNFQGEIRMFPISKHQDH